MLELHTGTPEPAIAQGSRRVRTRADVTHVRDCASYWGRMLKRQRAGIESQPSGARLLNMDGTAPAARKCQQRPASLYTASYMGESKPQQRAPAQSLDKLPRTLSAVNAARALRLHPPPPGKFQRTGRFPRGCCRRRTEEARLRQCHPSNNTPFLPACLGPCSRAGLYVSLISGAPIRK